MISFCCVHIMDEWNVMCYIMHTAHPDSLSYTFSQDVLWVVNMFCSQYAPLILAYCYHQRSDSDFLHSFSVVVIAFVIIIIDWLPKPLPVSSSINIICVHIYRWSIRTGVIESLISNHYHVMFVWLWLQMGLPKDRVPHKYIQIYSGWWFGCHFFNFPINIGFLIIPVDFHIFQRGGPTTNQIYCLAQNFFLKKASRSDP